MKNYSMENGLVANPVFSIYQDTKGFMWFCTPYGISNYNGYRFTNYTEQSGLSTSLVSGIYEDESGSICITLDNGQIDKIGEDSIEHNIADKLLYACRLYKQKDSSVLVATDEDGIVHISHGKIIPITQHLRGRSSSFYRLENGTYIIGGSFSKNDINVSSLLLTDSRGYLLAQAEKNRPSDVFNIYNDSRGHLWICSGNGLKLISTNDLLNGKISFLPLPAPFRNALLQNVVTDMLEDHYGNYWIATEQGLIRITPAGKLTRFTDADGLASNKIICLYQDRENNLWAGTTKGVTKIPLGGYIQYYTTDDGLADNDIQSVLSLSNHTVFFTTVNGNLQQINPETSVVKTLTRKTPGFFRFIKTHTGQIFVAHSSMRWVARELYPFDPETGTGKKIFSFDRDFFCVETDSVGNYLIGSAYGLYSFNPLTGNKYILGNITERIYDMVFDKQGYLWVSSFSGKLYQLKLIYDDNNVTAEVKNRTPLITGSKSSYLFIDSRGAVWVGTHNNGVVKLTPKDSGYKILPVPFKDGIMSFSSHISMEDDNGDFFLSSLLGLDKLIVNKSGKGKPYRVFNFSKENHFFDEAWSVSKTRNGVFWVATSSGLVRITDRYTERLPSPPVYITHIQTPQNTVSPGKHLTLAYNEGNLQFEFSSPSFINEKTIQYTYRLSGSSDENWGTPDNKHSVSYAGLGEGDYQFEVKVINHTGNASPAAVFSFTVRPPWWETWWFILFTVLGCTIIILFLLRRRIKNIRYEAEMKHRIAETEMMALRAQMNPHFIFNSINNIDAFVQSNDKYHATMYLNKFARLLRNVLDSSRQNTVSLSKDLETLQLYVALEQLRDKNKYMVTFDIEKSLWNADYSVPPLIVQPFVENAIIHGLRNKTENNGHLQITVSTQLPYIKYVIEDNGVGRKTTAASNVFKNKTSYGTQMSNDRIRFFNKEEEASVSVTDLEKDGKPVGTRVEVLLKVD
ncbi:hypothetical protein A9P82_14350 [Arachidicoccus ginsenosidimutans]|nr:hypothetical protein A9P82_14350 [Arachidicoccus sp. BS20]